MFSLKTFFIKDATFYENYSPYIYDDKLM